MKANKNVNVTMDEDDSQDGFVGRRHVLGDVTNFRGKRRYFSALGGSGLENENGKLGDNEFQHRVCKGVENLVKEKENVSLGLPISENVPFGDGENLSLLKAKRSCQSMKLGNGGDESTQDNVAMDISEVPLQIRELPRSGNCNLHLLRGDAVMHGIMEGAGSRDSCVSSAYLPRQLDKVKDSSDTIEGQDGYGKIGADITRNAVGFDDVNEPPVICAHEQSDKEKYVAGHCQFFTSSACNLQFVGSQESKTDAGESLNQASLDISSSNACLGDSDSLGSKIFGFEGTAKGHVSCSGNGGTNPSDSVDLDKTCSCPFCLKVAYLWSDLQYQDARDRLAALKKSRKQVRHLVASYNHNEAGKISCEGSDKSAKMELDLMHQWKSLFLHTEDVLVHESNQLQSNLLKLKYLRENCAMDLEMIKGVPSDNS